MAKRKPVIPTGPAVSTEPNIEHRLQGELAQARRELADANDEHQTLSLSLAERPDAGGEVHQRLNQLEQERDAHERKIRRLKGALAEVEKRNSSQGKVAELQRLKAEVSTVEQRFNEYMHLSLKRRPSRLPSASVVERHKDGR